MTTPSCKRMPELVCVKRAFHPQEVAIKLGLDEAVELLARVLGANKEDPDLSALSAALKTKLGVFHLKKLPPTVSPGAELLAKDVKGYQGICGPAMYTRPSPFGPRVRTMPVCNGGDMSETEMKSYRLTAVAPLAITHPSLPPDVTGGIDGLGRRTKAITTANLRIELPEFDPKNLTKGAEAFSEFLMVPGEQHVNIKKKCTHIKKARKKKFLQRQLTSAITKSSN